MPSRGSQLAFCPFCGETPAVSGLCWPCYRQRRHSIRYFAGLRESVLARDGFSCRGCGKGNSRAVHHRKPGVHDPAWLITLCPACHALIHRARCQRRWLPDPLLALWHEQHSSIPLQLQLEIHPLKDGV